MKVFRNIDFHSFVESLTKTIEVKDLYTAGHSMRVSMLVDLICDALCMKVEDSNYLHVTAHLHDIGKIGIPDGILLKTGKLSNAEYLIMQQHSVIGASVFEKQKGFEKMAEIIKHHHERFDGLGYPDGLKGNEIPEGSTIISIADSFDAMTTYRTYRPGMTFDDALNEMLKNRGKQFHPEIADIFATVCNRERERINYIINYYSLL